MDSKTFARKKRNHTLEFVMGLLMLTVSAVMISLAGNFDKTTIAYYGFIVMLVCGVFLITLGITRLSKLKQQSLT